MPVEHSIELAEEMLKSNFALKFEEWLVEEHPVNIIEILINEDKSWPLIPFLKFF